MAEISMEQVTTYLKQVADLETLLYKQKQVKKDARKSLQMPDVKKRDVPVPQKPESQVCPVQPTWMGAFFSNIENLLTAFFLGLGIWFALMLVLLVPMALIVSDPPGDLVWITLILGIIIAAAIIAYKKFSEAKRRYQWNLQAYNEYLDEERQFKLELQEYENAKRDADAQYAAAIRKAQFAYEVAEKEVMKLDEPLQETQVLLESFYEKNIIFEKYRNMVAVCTMYEYFASGRCTELMGPNGAYNLYEAELRQNLIINQLDKINENLEQVKQNQYILYKGIAETNQILGGVSADIKNILSTTTEIATSSRITAFCSQVTAANAQAQTYLAIMD